MATVTTMTPTKARGKLDAARGKLAAARTKLAAAHEAVQLAEEWVVQCERDVDAADTAVRAREEAQARAKAELTRAKVEREAEKARAKAERDAEKARAKAERDAKKAAATAERNNSGSRGINGADSSVVEELLGRYSAIRDNLEALSYAEIRARIGQFANYPKPVVAEVLRRLGYSADGSKADIIQAILTSLERIKGSLDEISRM